MAARQQIVRNKYLKKNTFEWICYAPFFEGEKCSNFFPFCGYHCSLYSKPTRRKNAIHHMDIYLKGYPAPHHKNISFYYTVYAADETRRESYIFKKGKIQTSGEWIEVVILKDDFKKFLNCRSIKIYFSWCEDEDHTVLMQNAYEKTGMSRSTSGIECATQTEDVQFLDSKNIRPNTEISANIIERSTQTESASTAGDISIDKKNETFKFLEILSNDLGSFYESKTDPDCVLKVEETEFHAHRSVLAARSTVFGAMFHHDTSESSSGKVDIIDVDAASLSSVLYYIYTGKIRELSPDTVATMYVVADKYALVDFRDKCLNFLMCNLTVDNVGEAALLAHTHAEMKLEDKVTEFIEERLDELGENERWKIFSDTHAKLANKLLFSAFISTKKKLAK